MHLIHTHVPNLLGANSNFFFNLKTKNMKKRNGLLAVLGLFLLPAITFAQQSPIYINCGNSGSVTYNSITYAADQYYSR